MTTASFVTGSSSGVSTIEALPFSKSATWDGSIIVGSDYIDQSQSPLVIPEKKISKFWSYVTDLLKTWAVESGNGYKVLLTLAS